MLIVNGVVQGFFERIFVTTSRFGSEDFSLPNRKLPLLNQMFSFSPSADIPHVPVSVGLAPVHRNH